MLELLLVLMQQNEIQCEYYFLFCLMLKHFLRIVGMFSRGAMIISLLENSSPEAGTSLL